MNTLSARLRAIAITLLVFALAAFVLGGVVIGLDRPPDLAAWLPSPPSSPEAWADSVLRSGAMRLVVAVFLIAAAGVLALGSRYLDRMLEIFADVLLMLVAARLGIALGSMAWAFIAAGGIPDAIDPPLSAFIPLLALGATIGVTLVFVPHRLRSALVLRLLGIIALVAAAPLVMTAPIFA